MKEINLYDRPPVQDTANLAEELKKNFVPEIESKTIEKLRGIEDMKQRQVEMNRLFPEERRKEMLALASRDTTGRPVRYFRHMTYDRLLNLLERGGEKPLSDQSEIDIDEGKVYCLLRDVLERRLEDLGIDQKDIFEREKALDSLSLEEQFAEVFPEAPIFEIKLLVDELSIAQMKHFIEKYLSVAQKKQFHIGSYLMEFSNYLSLSVGGPVRGYLNQGRLATVELIIPDDKINLSINSAEGEKEVLVRKIGTENISKVFASDEELGDYLLNDSESPVAQFVKEHNSLERDQRHPFSPDKIYSQRDAVEVWRWRTEREDYLPKKLADDLKARKNTVKEKRGS